MRSAFTVVVATLGLAGCFTKPPEPGDTGATTGVYRRKIDITQKPSAVLENFPLSVLLRQDASLVEHNPAADRIVFLDVNDQPLPCEISGYNGELGELDAWVRLPMVPVDAPTTLTLAYGDGITKGCDATTMWPFTEWRGVWHLSETIDDTAADSTPNGLDLIATTTAAPRPQASARVGYGREMTMNGQQLCRDIPIPMSEFQPGGAGFTVEVWFQASMGLRTSNDVIFQRGDLMQGFAGWGLRVSTSGWNPFVRDMVGNIAGNTTIAFASPLTKDAWTHLALVVDSAGTVFFYVNGKQAYKANSTLGELTSNAAICIGDDIFGVAGIVDEPRIETTARSQEWIEYAYTNVASRDAFLLIGPEK